MRTRNPYSRTNKSGDQERPSKLLLVSTRRAVDSGVSSIRGAQQFHSSSAREALCLLDSETFDLILLGTDFNETEKTLFLLDAQRRGFKGAILHLVSEAILHSQSSPTQESEERGEPLPFPSFSQREQQVLERVAGGWTNFQIARDLRCSEGSVKSILQQLFAKLGVRKRTQIVRLAFERGVTAAPLNLDR